MIDTRALATVRCLETDELRLVPMGPEHFDGVWAMLADSEVMRLTATRATFTEQAIRDNLAALPNRADRADWAVLRKADERYLGEVVLNEFDVENESMNFRIALFGADVLGKGYGTQATEAVVSYGFDAVGLHRIELGVYAFNPRAQRAYEKAGFVREGVRREALLWDGERHDEIVMAVLRSDYELRHAGRTGR